MQIEYSFHRFIDPCGFGAVQACTDFFVLEKFLFDGGKITFCSPFPIRRKFISII